MENGERVIISGKATPKTGLLAAGIFMIIAVVAYMIIGFKTNRNGDLSNTTLILVGVGVFVAIILLRFYFKSKKSVITVTNRRISGSTAWGSTIDLPLNQVVSTAIESTGALIVMTNSGKIIFAKMDNTSQIVTEINNLLLGLSRI